MGSQGGEGGVRIKGLKIYRTLMILPYAFPGFLSSLIWMGLMNQEFGFLTSCPTNAGTGLRASILIHLPALVLTREIGRILQGS